jgi:hypothetical protein
MIDIDLVEFDYHKPTSIKRLFGIGTGKQEVLCQQVDKIILDQIELKFVSSRMFIILKTRLKKSFFERDVLQDEQISDFGVQRFS